MATTDFIWGRQPAFEVTVKNTDGSNDLALYNLVTLDAANPLSSTQAAPGVKQSTTDDLIFGVAIEPIKKGEYGRVQIGGIVPVISASGVTAQTCVQADASGKVKTCAGGKAQAGQAVTGTSGNNDIMLMQIAIARNA